jgi:1-acyl-sn-glycerol-3-phosphate acyltransferase
VRRYLAFWLRAAGGVAGFGLTFAYCWVRRYILGASLAEARVMFFRTMARLCCAPTGLNVRIVGREHLERVQPCVYASNHQSQLDYPIIGWIFPEKALIMASRVGNWPIIGKEFRIHGIIPLERDVPQRAVAGLEEGKRVITEDGLSVWMFPEGTRGKVRGRLGKFKRGAFRMAAETGVPVVPIVISPLLPETDVRRRRLIPHDVIVTIFEPVYANGPTPEDADALRANVQAFMQRKLDEYR